MPHVAPAACARIRPLLSPVCYAPSFNEGITMIIAERQLPHNLLRYLVCGLNGYALGIESTKQGFGLRRPRSGPSAFKGTSARWPHILPRHRNCAILSLAIQ